MKPPTRRCEACRWWRERYSRQWCANPSPPAFIVTEHGHECEDFTQSSADDWRGMVYGNTDTRETHC
ncbi:MAG: hypothetical protein RSB98_00885 [Raoultibacter sp.]